MFLYNILILTMAVIVIGSFVTKATTSNNYQCQDTITNCNEYDNKTYLCSNYRTWAKINCQRYCRLCTGTTSTASGGTFNFLSCKDNITDCHDYGNRTDLCTSYPAWAYENCQKYCGLCKRTTTTAPQETTSNFHICQDNVADCHEYNNRTYLCVSYRAWANENCKKYCGFCTGPPGTTSNFHVCQDHITDCHKLGNRTYLCSDYRAWANVNCQKYCGFCTGTQSAGTQIILGK